MRVSRMYRAVNHQARTRVLCGHLASGRPFTSGGDIEQRARATYAIPAEEMQLILSEPGDYEIALQACANNAKIGPFTATSGLILV